MRGKNKVVLMIHNGHIM